MKCKRKDCNQEARVNKKLCAVCAMSYNSNGAKKKWKTAGHKSVTSIRLSNEEKALILTHFDSVQHFIQECMLKLVRNDPRDD